MKENLSRSSIWCSTFGHKWMQGAEPHRNVRPWDGICPARWCQRCGRMEAHYRRGTEDWWEIIPDMEGGRRVAP